MRRAASLLHLAALLLNSLAGASWVLPIKFVPLVADGTALLPLFANTSLDGVFVTGLEVGTPPQSMQLLIDTGSGVTHIAAKGCGSACGLLLPPSVGFNASASSTAEVLPCGAQCSCPQCACGPKGCIYSLRYVDGSTSSGGLISDVIGWAGRPVRQLFGLQARQTGKVQGQNIQGLLALDRSPTSFVGQLRADPAVSNLTVFGTCWEFEHNGAEQGYPNSTAFSFLMMGLPEAVERDLGIEWTPVDDSLDSYGGWQVQLESIEVAGPAGGSVTSELWETAMPPQPAAADGSSSSSSSSGGAAAAPAAAPRRSAPLVVDSGTTFLKLPRAAFTEFQQLVIAEAAARGRTQLMQSADAATCWQLTSPGALVSNASEIEEAFPPVTFRFAGGASFTADARGYLTKPDNDPQQQYACLSFFPWAASSPPEIASTVLMGSRIRRGVLTVHDDVNERVGFARVEDCNTLAMQWEEAMDVQREAAADGWSAGSGGAVDSDA